MRKQGRKSHRRPQFMLGTVLATAASSFARLCRFGASVVAIDVAATGRSHS
jgi:hypothetical protein